MSDFGRGERTVSDVDPAARGSPRRRLREMALLYRADACRTFEADARVIDFDLHERREVVSSIRIDLEKARFRWRLGTPNKTVVPARSNAGRADRG